jgi:hypothetical protein
LKPEIDTVFNVLIALDPKRITAIAGVAKSYSRAATQGAYRVSHILGESESARSESNGLSWAPGKQFAEFLGSDQGDDDILARMWELTATPRLTPEDLASADEFLGVGRALVNWFNYAVRSIDGSPRKALRAALADWGGGQEIWKVNGACPVYDGLAGVQPKADVVVAGHTHLRRQKWLAPESKGPLYLNTGTWARLMRLTSKILDSDQLFRDVWIALPAGSKNHMPDGVLIDQPTVAVIRPQRGDSVQAALCEFKGGARDPFQLVEGATWENVGRPS